MLNFDIETTGLSFATDEFRIAASQIDDEEIQIHYSVDAIAIEIVEYLQGGGKVAGHNIISFDLPFILSKLEGNLRVMLILTVRQEYMSIIDTLVLSRINRADITGNSMDEWCKRLKLESKVEIDNWEDATDTEIRRRVIRDVEIQKEITDHLSKLSYPLVEKYIKRIYPFIVESLGNGIPIYMDEVPKIRKRLLNDRAVKGMEVYRLFGNMNPNSTKQIDAELEKKYGEGLPRVEKVSQITGETINNPSFSKKNEAEVLRKFPDLQAVLDYRSEDKQLSFLSYEGKKSLLNKEKVRYTHVYPGFSFMSQEGLRSSYKEPPINQVDKRIRSLIGKPAYICVGIDIKSLEFWELADVLRELFGIHDLSDELETGEDPPKKTVEIFGNLFKNISEDKRRAVAKTINYGTIFGQGVTGNRSVLKLSKSYTDKVMEAREKRFPGLQRFIDFLENEKDHEGKIENKYGVKINVRGYKALNYFIQSSGAMAAYMSLGLLYENINKEYPSVTPMLYNHDEIQMLIPVTEVSGLKESIKRIVKKTENELESKTLVKYQLKFDVQMGNSWESSH